MKEITEWKRRMKVDESWVITETAQREREREREREIRGCRQV